MLSKINLRVGARIFSIVVVAVLACATLAFMLNSQSARNQYEMREIHLRDVIASATSILDHLNAQVEAGAMSLEAAQAQGAELLSAVSYDNGNYLFGFTEAMDTVIHGGNRDLIGTNQADLQAPDGVYVYRGLLAAGQVDGGSTFSYIWPRNAGSDIQARKLSFVAEFEPWGWMLGAGRFVDDIEEAIAVTRNTTLAVLAMVLAGLVVVALLIGRTVTGPVNQLRSRMLTLAQGDVETGVPATAKKDELGEMARSVEAFRIDLQRNRELEAKATEARQEQELVVAELDTALQKLSQGNLVAAIEVPFPGEYEELRRAFNTTIASLSDAISTVQQNALAVREESTSISNGADDLSLRTEKQAAALEETAAALDQMTSAVREAADSAEEARMKSNDTQLSAQNCGEIAERTARSMTDIQSTSDEISKIIGIIDDIAFQTNLLALNAGVEAARAGSAGAGFAVVASEVRALAKRSAEAAGEINALITSSIAKIHDGVELVGDTKTALDEIITSISEITGRVDGIASATQDQSSGLGEINIAMTELDQMTQQNAAMFEETSAASQSLQGEANTLSSTVSRFDLGDQPKDPFPDLHLLGEEEEDGATVAFM